MTANQTPTEAEFVTYVVNAATAHVASNASQMFYGDIGTFSVEIDPVDSQGCVNISVQRGLVCRCRIRMQAAADIAAFAAEAYPDLLAARLANCRRHINASI